MRETVSFSRGLTHRRCSERVKSGSSTPGSTIKYNVHVRFLVSQTRPLWDPCLPKSKEVGRYRVISGTVVRASKQKLVEQIREMKCKKCGFQFVLK